MQSKATTVEQYIASLPEDRRGAIKAIRKVILDNLDKDYQEGMQYGMIGYSVPHSIYPHGYHCDPKQPLPFAMVASQKNHLAIYLMCSYGNKGEAEWFRKAWAKSGKKLDMGKSCVRFKKIEECALDVIGEAVRRVPAKKYIEQVVGILASTGRGPDGKKLKDGKGGAAKPAKKKAAKKVGRKAAR